jgi:hypothetical protein
VLVSLQRTELLRGSAQLAHCQNAVLCLLSHPCFTKLKVKKAFLEIHCRSKRDQIFSAGSSVGISISSPGRHFAPRALVISEDKLDNLQ